MGARAYLPILFLLAIGSAWFLLFKDRVVVAVDVPAELLRGSVVLVTGSYESNGRIRQTEYFRGALDGQSTLDVRLPRRDPGSWRGLRVDFAHPRFQPASVHVDGNPHWFRRSVSLSPAPWATKPAGSYVQPDEARSRAALLHLRWLNAEYLSIAEPLLAVETLLQARTVLGSLAYAGGSKEPEWELLRQSTIAEFENLDAFVLAQQRKPCPENFVARPSAVAPCGLDASGVIWPE